MGEIWMKGRCRYGGRCVSVEEGDVGAGWRGGVGGEEDGG